MTDVQAIGKYIVDIIGMLLGSKFFPLYFITIALLIAIYEIRFYRSKKDK